MAIAAATMNNNDDEKNNNNKDNDDHGNDMVMPGFRFHPTEEELIEFYLRRKVEGKRFNVELITFLDLYRYDPWELPVLAAIGEKEWFFYVPRDRKYRNGDRPNRVTTSGYWKATGADRMVKSENYRSIGLKKTLVFYSGKAPKGIRTSWIMNEYRLPQHETERYQKFQAEISICRVYKRAGVEDHPALPRSLPTSRASSSIYVSWASTTQSDKDKHHLHHNSQNAAVHHSAIERLQAFGGGQSPQQQMEMAAEKISTNSDQTDGSSSCSDVTTVLGLSKQNVYRPNLAAVTTSLRPSSLMEEEVGILVNQSKQSTAAGYSSSSLVPNCSTTLFPAALSSSSSASVSSNAAADEFHKLLTNQQASLSQPQQQYYNYHQLHHHHLQFSTLPTLQSQPPLSLNTLPAAFPDRLWEWNLISEANREYNGPFK